MINPDTAPEIKNIAERLIATKGDQGVVRVDPIYGGGNNRSYLVTINNHYYFLKHYFRDPRDKRDRLATEFQFSSFAWDQGVRNLAKPIASDPENSIGIYEYIQGRKLSAEEMDYATVQEALNFVLRINEKNHTESAHALPIASEACFSIADHIRLVNVRMSRLHAITVNDDEDDEAVRVVNEELAPEWMRIKDEVCNKISPDELLDQKLGISNRILSPSDFGFHNALLDQEGKIRFFDFEYAGWDDPAKLVCDFFSQPAVPVPMQYFDEFAKVIAGLVEDSAGAEDRMRTLLPLIRIKWCCIALNCFVTAFKARKIFVSPITGEYKLSQINKVRTMLDLVK